MRFLTQNRFYEDILNLALGQMGKQLKQNCTLKRNNLIESFEKSVGIQFLWTNIKPLIRGKILYSPDTPATR